MSSIRAQTEGAKLKNTLEEYRCDPLYDLEFIKKYANDAYFRESADAIKAQKGGDEKAQNYITQESDNIIKLVAQQRQQSQAFYAETAPKFICDNALVRQLHFHKMDKARVERTLGKLSQIPKLQSKHNEFLSKQQELERLEQTLKNSSSNISSQVYARQLEKINELRAVYSKNILEITNELTSLTAVKEDELKSKLQSLQAD